MCTKAECEKYVGQWVGFRSKYGYHVGMIEKVTDKSAIMVSPRKHIPAEFASANITADEVERLDIALAWGGFGGGGFGGGAGGYGGSCGGGYGWGFGWGRWAVSFLIIYVLWGLAWWW